jgi:hypothetical protein
VRVISGRTDCTVHQCSFTIRAICHGARARRAYLCGRDARAPRRRLGERDPRTWLSLMRARRPRTQAALGRARPAHLVVTYAGETPAHPGGAWASETRAPGCHLCGRDARAPRRRLGGRDARGPMCKRPARRFPRRPRALRAGADDRALSNMGGTACRAPPHSSSKRRYVALRQECTLSITIRYHSHTRQFLP